MLGQNPLILASVVSFHLVLQQKHYLDSLMLNEEINKKGMTCLWVSEEKNFNDNCFQYVARETKNEQTLSS